MKGSRKACSSGSSPWESPRTSSVFLQRPLQPSRYWLSAHPRCSDHATEEKQKLRDKLKTGSLRTWLRWRSRQTICSQHIWWAETQSRTRNRRLWAIWVCSNWTQKQRPSKIGITIVWSRRYWGRLWLFYCLQHGSGRHRKRSSPHRCTRFRCTWRGEDTVKSLTGEKLFWLSYPKSEHLQ